MEIVVVDQLSLPKGASLPETRIGGIALVALDNEGRQIDALAGFQQQGLLGWTQIRTQHCGGENEEIEPDGSSIRTLEFAIRRLEFHSRS